MDGQFKLGGMTLKLTKDNGTDLKVEYELGEDSFADSVEAGEMKKFISNLKRFVDELYMDTSKDYLKYIDPQTAEKLKALGIKDLSYIARGLRE